jgi:hypothetical protein
MDKESFILKVESTIQKINKFNFKFAESDAQNQADELLETAIQSLEEYISLVEEDTNESDDETYE